MLTLHEYVQAIGMLERLTPADDIEWQGTSLARKIAYALAEQRRMQHELQKLARELESDADDEIKEIGENIRAIL